MTMQLDELSNPFDYWKAVYNIGEIDTCKLCSICKYNKPLLGMGNQKAEIVIVAEALGKTEVEKRIPLCGKAGKIFDKALKEAGIDRDSLWITNTVAGNPLDPKTGRNRTPKNSEINSCFPHVLEELKRLPNLKVIVTFGRVPLEAFLQKRITALKDYVGKEIKTPNGFTIIPSYHPASVLYQDGSSRYSDIVYSLKQLKNREKEQELNYNTVKTLEQFNEFYKELDEAKYCSVDIETSGLDIYSINFSILGISFSLRAGHGIYIPLNTPSDLELFGDSLQPYWSNKNEEYIISKLKIVLEDKKKVKIGQGFTFDYQCLKQMYKIESYWHFDTLHLEKQVDETAAASLEVLIKKYCPELINIKTLIKKKSDGAISGKSFKYMPLDILSEYACGDTDATLRVFLKQWQVLKHEHRNDNTKIMMEF